MIMPMFLFSGTFFPVSILPKWVHVIAWCPAPHPRFLPRARVRAGMAGGHLVWSALYILVLAVVLMGCR